MQKWLIANWKMNGDAARVRAFAFEVNQALASAPADVRVVFCPPALWLAEAGRMLPLNARLQLGGQTCHAEPKGAYTGEISAAMLKHAGAEYVILGHSERRAMGETDADVRAKAQAARAAGLVPVLCVGESREAYEAGRTEAVLAAQVEGLAVLAGTHYLVAYEPVWAIGSGLTPKTAEISAAHRQIKSILGSGTPVLYGGSVNVANLGEILALPEVAGALIGGASLESETMKAMIAIAAK